MDEWFGTQVWKTNPIENSVKTNEKHNSQDITYPAVYIDYT